MSNHWDGPSSSSYNMHHYDIPGLHDPRSVSFNDDYEDADELSELPESSMSAAAQKKADEKQIRRRSSKGAVLALFLVVRGRDWGSR